ncbi:hypothetical protein ACH5RR_040724 [Cinchona calisaya]|uniref:Uncharacterized protein n=1 Tax=Cinchona calisaya TaxID=153742 RepID=A0ABD2XUL5_9GENT
MGIRSDLHPVTKEFGKVYLPAAMFTMDKNEKTTFCKVLKKFNQESRNKDRTENTISGLDVFTIAGPPLGKSTSTKFDEEILRKAHQYVLFNCEYVKPYIQFTSGIAVF